eukprot:CAMPEP_0185391858 /NCGR_PEP_ID=MMETSP1364-20130426/75285_1 /TAXON_ID=38817 /ORGANISM="Gephyrocapsa oceanica, Strain RCC1303" /LENGTH=83 /DNA_ID=CAMNT_0027993889 /DNA_START=31 /DNA_END=283 /DNA_ORIENTATION=+
MKMNNVGWVGQRLALRRDENLGIRRAVDEGVVANLRPKLVVHFRNLLHVLLADGGQPGLHEAEQDHHVPVGVLACVAAPGALD